MAAFSAAPTRVIPPAIRPDSANARSFVAVMTVILRASGPMRLIADENTSMSISGAANTTALAILRVELTQAFERQHRSHAVRDDVDAAGAGDRHDGLEHTFEAIARPHRAVAVIGVVEQSRFGGPGEDHRPATELDRIGKVRGIERRGLEGLFKSVHVDQDVQSAGLRKETAELSRHRLDLINTPIGKSDRGERDAAVIRRH